jgi:hypothetical protein
MAATPIHFSTAPPSGISLPQMFKHLRDIAHHDREFRPACGTDQTRSASVFRDTRRLFQNPVQAIVHRAIGSFAALLGLDLLEFKDFKPEPPLAAFPRRLLGG